MTILIKLKQDSCIMCHEKLPKRIVDMEKLPIFWQQHRNCLNYFFNSHGNEIAILKKSFTSLNISPRTVSIFLEKN